MKTIIKYTNDSKSGQNSGEGEDESNQCLSTSPKHGIKGIHLKAGGSVNAGHSRRGNRICGQRSDDSGNQYKNWCETKGFVPTERPEGNTGGEHVYHYR